MVRKERGRGGRREGKRWVSGMVGRVGGGGWGKLEGGAEGREGRYAGGEGVGGGWYREADVEAKRGGGRWGVEGGGGERGPGGGGGGWGGRGARVGGRLWREGRETERGEKRR